MTRLMMLVAMAGASAVALPGAAYAQSTTTMSTLATDGFEVRTSASVRINPNDPNSGEATLIIMQKDGDVYGCLLRAGTSRCQKID